MSTAISSSLPISAKQKSKAVSQSSVINWTTANTYVTAFCLAFYVLPIKAIAQQIAQEAIDIAKIKYYEKESHRRRWLDNDRYKKDGPTSLLMHHRQMIQHFILHESQKYERYQEGERSDELKKEIKTALNSHSIQLQSLLNLLENAELTNEDLIVRYLEANVLFSNNNSKDLVTAITCLICNLSPQEASELHVKFKQISPNYCSKRKSLLLKKLAQRFKSFIKVCKSDGKQTYFTGQEKNSPKMARLVEEFLSLLVPWGTTCPEGKETCFSERLHNWLEKIVNVIRLRFMIEQDWQELGYLHALTCPNCFLSLTQEIKLGCPRGHLALPDFSLLRHGEEQKMKKQDRHIQLTQADSETLVKSIDDYLQHQQARRAAIDVKHLTLLANHQPLVMNVNGQETNTMDITQANTATFLVSEVANTIKIISEDAEGALPLAVLEIPSRETTQTFSYYMSGERKFFIPISENQHIVLKMRLKNGAEPDAQFLCQLTFYKNQPQPQIEDSHLNRDLLPKWTLQKQLLIVTLLITLLIGSVMLWKNWFSLVQPSESNLAKNIDPLPSLTEGVSRGTTAAMPTPTPNNLYSTPTNVVIDTATYELNTRSTEPALISLATNIKTLKLKLNFSNNELANTKQCIAEVFFIDSNKDVWKSNTLKIKAYRKNRWVVLDIPSYIFQNGEYGVILRDSYKTNIDSELVKFSLLIKTAS